MCVFHDCVFVFKTDRYRPKTQFVEGAEKQPHGGTLKPGSIFCAHSQVEAPNSWKRTDVGIHSNNAVLSGNISASSPNLIVQLGI